MKKVFILVLILKSVNIFAQHSDCITAIPFCSEKGEGLPTVSPGDGNVHNETRLSCVDNEGFSTWYTFTPTSDGIFNFVLTPSDAADDYDWALFNITGFTCSDIPNISSLKINCNSYGNFGSNGPTGISTNLGGVGLENGPGNTNGPPFNADLKVFAGNTYKLMVSNWSESTDGFRIDVSGSTAEGVFARTKVDNFSSEEICLGDTTTIDVEFTGTIFGTLVYRWEPANLFINPNVEDPVFKEPLKATTDIALAFSNGVCKYNQTEKIFVGTMEYDKENKDKNTCLGEKVQLGINFTGEEFPSGLHYTWSPFDLINSAGSSNPTTIELKDTTVFYFKLENGSCPIVEDSLFVFIHYDTVNADFDFQINDVENTIPIEVDFTNLSFGNATYKWDFGDSTIYLERNPVQHQYPGYDTYQIVLAVESESSFCVDTARKEIVFPEVVFPNIITPNNDGLNDKFTITGLKVGTGLKIYNRWGKLIFDAENYLHDWNAENIPDGMYFFEFIDLDENSTKGWLQVVR